MDLQLAHDTPPVLSDTTNLPPEVPGHRPFAFPGACHPEPGRLFLANGGEGSALSLPHLPISTFCFLVSNFPHRPVRPHRPNIGLIKHAKNAEIKQGTPLLVYTDAPFAGPPAT